MATTACVASALLVAPTTARADDAPGRLGTNLAGVTYYDGATIFADIVDQAGDWVPQREGAPWGTGAPLDLRRDGWPARLAPGQYVSTVIADNRYPRGDYSVSWRGSGRLRIAGKSFEGSDGAGSVALDGTSTAVLDILATDPADPVRDVQVRVPGSAPNDTFTREYLSQLAPYRVVRFMDWQRTNSVPWEAERSFTCADRVQQDHYSQGTRRGASVEMMVALANTTRKDPWFTIPHEASPDWVRCHSRYVAAALDPTLTPRYEFSNETWNPAFRAFHDLSDEAARLGLGDGDRYLGLQLLVGRRHVQAMEAVAEEMGARPFVRVLSGQAANPWVLEQRLSVARSTTDEIAIAPYLGVGGNPFDEDEARRIGRWGRAEVVARMRENQTVEVDRWVAEHVRLARETGKRLVAYEGGQHLAGHPDDDGLTELFTGVNRDPAIGGLYRTYLSRWREATGNALMMHFTDVGPYTRHGSWGALERTGQDPATSPKYVALAAFAGVALPGVPPSPSPPSDAPSTGGARADVLLAAGARFTRHREVPMALTWPAGATRVRVTDIGRGSGTRSFSRRDGIRWHLTGTGRVGVRATFLGPGSTQRSASDTITLDRSAPRVHSARMVGSRGIRSRVNDRGSGVATVVVAPRRSAKGAVTLDYRPRLALPERLARGGRLWARFSDAAGNSSAWRPLVPE